MTAISDAGCIRPDDLLSVFPSDVGWMGIVGRDEVVRSVTIGHASVASVRKAARQLAALDSRDGQFEETDWYPSLRERLQAYAEGQRATFDEFVLDIPHRTRFRDKVLAATRRLGYGETTSYGDLARRVGHPGAARAVGTAMSTNRFPILIPCHRVLAAGGKLGGYSSPSGVSLKQRLLDMERGR